MIPAPMCARALRDKLLCTTAILGSYYASQGELEVAIAISEITGESLEFADHIQLSVRLTKRHYSEDASVLTLRNHYYE
jgi:hypothetical protein